MGFVRGCDEVVKRISSRVVSSIPLNKAHVVVQNVGWASNEGGVVSDCDSASTQVSNTTNSVADEEHRLAMTRVSCGCYFPGIGNKGPFADSPAGQILDCYA